MTAVKAAIGARTDLSFDGATLTYTGDGSNPMTNLVDQLGCRSTTTRWRAEESYR